MVSTNHSREGHPKQVAYKAPRTHANMHTLCFAGWLSEYTASHTAQNNTLWSNVEYFAVHKQVCNFLLCGGGELSPNWTHGTPVEADRISMCGLVHAHSWA